EAAVASGSLITARLASEQGREVFAIPGSIHAPQSRGCHALIRQGAKLVETAQDIIEELAHSHPSAPSTPIKRRRSLAAQQAGLDLGATPAPAPAHPILDALGFDPMGLDTLSARTGLDAASLQAQLLELELEGWVASQPGGLFQRVAQA
ncbi:MAG: DNA-processing protein DprA, partial [Comamonas sp.]|nr:DNA-processing protein DprA [Comamonas sp.]